MSRLALRWTQVLEFFLAVKWLGYKAVTHLHLLPAGCNKGEILCWLYTYIASMSLSLRFPGVFKLIITNKEHAVSSSNNMLTNKGWIFSLPSQFHKLKAHLSEMSHLEHESLIRSKTCVSTFVVRLKPYISHTQKSADIQLLATS